MTAPRVLITRPREQTDAFAQRCETLGFDVALLPCLEILPLTLSDQQLKLKLAPCQHLVFTSANAVRLAHRIVPLPWPGHKVYAIGQATAHALSSLGQTLSLTPNPPYNSEALLEQLAPVPAASLLVIKGRGGRGLIQSVLERRGWQIDSVDVYERAQPVVTSEIIDTLFSQRLPDIISVTSDQILQNLWALSQSHVQTLIRLPLVVNSQRCADLAQSLGFINDAWVANSAGDAGQLDCLLEWKSSLYSHIQDQ